MAGRDWQDAIGGAERSVGQGEANRPSGIPLPEELQRLMDERRRLERRMASITGQDEGDPRAAVLGRVAPMADRLAAHRQWQDGRDSARVDAADRLVQARRTVAQRLSERLDARGQAGVRDALPLRPTSAERPRRRYRRLSDSDAFVQARDAAGGFTRDLDEARSRLDREAGPGARDSLDRALRDTGIDKLEKGARKLDGVLGRFERLERAPERAKRVIENDWVERATRAGGENPSRYARGFDTRSDRLLGVRTGSVEDMQRRSERLREASLERRRRARIEEEQTELRRRRAQQRRDERREEERADERRRTRALERRQGRFDG